MASYTPQQIAFAFSMISNAATALPAGQPLGVYEQAIVDNFETITQTFPEIVGTGWSVVWGPKVYSSPTHPQITADNALLVVRGTGEGGNPFYIVATAATNPQSQFDRHVEDLSLTPVPFPAGGRVSTGTMDGVDILLGLESGGSTLQQFLDARASDTATLVFTGHSLGGTLTPALALSVESRGWGKVYTLPTAGLTAGDASFVSAFAARFPPAAPAGATSTWNRNVVNSNDAYPKCWTSVGEISGLYPQLGPPSPCISAIQRSVESRLPVPNPFANIAQVTFQAAFQPPPPDLANDGTLQFVYETRWQHIEAYGLEIIPDLLGGFQSPGFGPEQWQCVHDLCAQLEEATVAR